MFYHRIEKLALVILLITVNTAEPPLYHPVPSYSIHSLLLCPYQIGKINIGNFLEYFRTNEFALLP